MRHTADLARTRLNVEGMEERAVPAQFSLRGLFDRAAAVNVSTETNNPADGQNAVLGFHRGADGSLTPIANSTAQFPVGTFATQALVSRDGRFLFVDVSALDGISGGNTVITFRINGDGSLTAAPGGPASSGAGVPVLLGAAQHPRLNIVYTGFAAVG